MTEEWLKQGVLGLVAFSLGGALVYVYLDARKADRRHASELANLTREWRVSTVDLMREVHTMVDKLADIAELFRRKR